MHKGPAVSSLISIHFVKGRLDLSLDLVRVGRLVQKDFTDAAWKLISKHI